VTILLGIRRDGLRNAVQQFLEAHGHEIIPVFCAKDIYNLASHAHIIVTEFSIERPHTVLFTRTPDLAHLRQLVSRGVRGVVFWKEGFEALAEAINIVHAGGRRIPQSCNPWEVESVMFYGAL
jgi:DNA-binding NarL/FixJ family response regulator